MTAPELLAVALREQFRIGPHICFYCGARCSADNSSADLVKSSFTGLSDVAAPGSRYVCDGCVIALRESATITLANGEVRHGQKSRCYSWLLTSNKAIAATKSHREIVLRFCLDPPEPPFVLCVSESGQKHLLYRAKVCHSRTIITATLELETVRYRPIDLHARLELCRRLIAVVGKPALSERLSANRGMMIVARWGDDLGQRLLAEWHDVSDESLTRLAMFLSPGKDECANDCERLESSFADGACLAVANA